MKKKIILFVPIFVACAAFLLVFLFSVADSSSMSGDNATSSRGMSIEQYIQNSISEISSTKAVLGGTFYVTDVVADGGVGAVHYEDGHIALVADFTYEIEEEHGGILITSFTVRK